MNREERIISAYENAKEIYAFVDAYWQDEFGAKEGMDAAERKIIDGLMNVGTDSAYEQAAERAEALGDEQRQQNAIIARARLAMDSGDNDKAETLLTPLADSEEALALLHELIYKIAAAAKEQLDYPTAIERFASLGDYSDAAAQREDSIYLYGRQLMRAGEYQAACDQFMLVSDVGDAVALIRQCRYALAAEQQKAGEYEAAAELYESLGVYEEAETRAKYCRYMAGVYALALSAYLIAQQKESKGKPSVIGAVCAMSGRGLARLLPDRRCLRREGTRTSPLRRAGGLGAKLCPRTHHGPGVCPGASTSF